MFGQIIGLAFDDVVEAAEGVGDLDVFAFLAGELLGNVEGLAEATQLVDGGVCGDVRCYRFRFEPLPRAFKSCNSRMWEMEIVRQSSARVYPRSS